MLVYPGRPERPENYTMCLYCGIRLDDWQVPNLHYFDYSWGPGLKTKYLETDLYSSQITDNLTILDFFFFSK